jgi:hypothetical protein
MPYPQWDDPQNQIHALQWRLARLCMQAAERAERTAPERADTLALRAGVDEGLHSCQFWWASCRPWWDVGMIAAGAERLAGAVVAGATLVDPELLAQARALAQEIVATARRWHDSGEARARKQQYRARTPEVTSELTFGEREEAGPHA